MLQRVVKITDEIYQVGGYELTAPEDAAIYLVHFQGHAALIDTAIHRTHETHNPLCRPAVDSRLCHVHAGTSGDF